MRKIFCFLFLPAVLPAYIGLMEDDEAIKPWFATTLLASSGNTVGGGRIDFKPDIFAFARTSFYNNDWEVESVDTLWNLRFRAPLRFGISNPLEIKITPEWNWNYREGKAQWTLGDFSADLGIQIHRDRLPHTSWLPSIKFSIRETFPTGKYQKLDPKKLGTDSDGAGAWETSFLLNMSKIFHIYKTHFLNLYLNLLYSIPTTVHVKGFNAYGGGFGTDGTVHPERVFSAIFSFEYSLTRNWAFACDFRGRFTSKTTFSGTPGTVPANDGSFDPAGLPASNEDQASIQYSMAPAFEYNWSDNLGLVAGVWVTLAGKNSSRFTTGAIKLNYAH